MCSGEFERSSTVESVSPTRVKGRGWLKGENPMYVVTGATGNIGKVLTETLLAKGKKVRAVGRSSERLQQLVEKGAEAFVGSVTDAAAMTNAFDGAQAAFLMVPPNYAAEDSRGYINQVADVYTQAIRQTGLRFIVNLSSVGAQLAHGAGPISALHDVEEKLNRLQNINIVHLRCAFFMENLFFSIDLIKNQNINGSALKGELLIPVIATRDIAQVAAERLLSFDFFGQSSRELLGQRDLSMKEATQILGKAIGKNELPYVQFSYEQAEQALRGMGASMDSARSLIEMDRALNEGRVRALETRTAANTTPTSFEQFAKIFAAVYGKQESARSTGA
jgi:uncharacterized protein YbjT (DUF2867 family)